jgi:hypothetical protein
MADISPTIWFPVLTLFIGFVTRPFSDWIQHRLTVGRDREAREATRRDERTERRNAFQRDTLLNLQEAVMQLSRSTATIHHKDKMSRHSTGKPALLPDDLDEGHRLGHVRVSMFSARVRDQSVRDLVEQLRQLSEGSVKSTAQTECNQSLNAMFQVSDELNQRIGELLRTLDDADS